MGSGSQTRDYGSQPPAVMDFTGQGLGLQRVGSGGGGFGGGNSLQNLMTLLNGGGVGDLMGNKLQSLSSLSSLFGGSNAGRFGLSDGMPQPAQFGIGAVPTDAANLPRFDTGALPTYTGRGFGGGAGATSAGDALGQSVGQGLAQSGGAQQTFNILGSILRGLV